MAYKIAFASSDGRNIDQTFGQASEFTIVEVEDSGNYSIIEKRSAINEMSESSKAVVENAAIVCHEIPINNSGSGQGNPSGCSSNCHTGGCQDSNSEIPKLTLIEDCRCIICKKIGFKVQKQLSKKAIANFDVECSVEEALRKIILYFERMDNHKTLRGIANQETLHVQKTVANEPVY